MMASNGSGTCRTSLLAFAVIAALTGCGQGTPQPPRGFALPDGNIDQGQAAFMTLGCPQCHVVAGTPLPPYDGVSSLEIELGGKVRQVTTYADLMTSVVNPDHRLAEQYQKLLTEDERRRSDSPMPNFNDRMTVQQLIDIIAFLHSRYEKLPEYRGDRYGP